MRFMNWGWLDLQTCPADLIPVIAEEADREVKAREKAAREAKQRSRGASRPRWSHR